MRILESFCKKGREILSKYLPPILAIWQSFAYFLAPLTILLGVLGYMFSQGNPVITILSFFMAGFSICLLGAILLEGIIEIVLGFRWIVITKWKELTPPYIQDNNPNLPAADLSSKESIQIGHRYLQISIVLYTLMFVVSLFLATQKPVWIIQASNSEYIVLGSQLLLGIFQIPTSLLGSELFLEAVPDANTKWDAIIRFLILVPPLLPLVIVVSNYRFYIQRQRTQLYRTIVNEFAESWSTERGASLSSQNIETEAVLFDGVRTVFILLFVTANTSV